MGILVCILGGNGMGKSCSMRNFCIRKTGLEECDVHYNIIHNPTSKAFCKYYNQKEESEVN